MLKENTTLSELWLGGNSTLDAETCRELEALAAAKRLGRKGPGAISDGPGASLSNLRAWPPGQAPAQPRQQQQQQQHNGEQRSELPSSRVGASDEATKRDDATRLRDRSRDPETTTGSPPARQAPELVPGRPGEVAPLNLAGAAGRYDAPLGQQPVSSGLRVLPHETSATRGEDAVVSMRPRDLSLDLVFTSPAKRDYSEWY
jgi:hypothetical protein